MVLDPYTDNVWSQKTKTILGNELSGEIEVVGKDVT
jgi:hypothetical protein